MDVGTTVATGVIATVVGGLVLTAILGVFAWLRHKHRARKAQLAEPVDARTAEEMHDDISLRVREAHRAVALRDKPWKATYLMGDQLEIQNRGLETATEVELEGSESCFVVATSRPSGEVDGGEIVELRLARTFGAERWVDVRWRWLSDPSSQVKREQRIDLGTAAEDEPPAPSPAPPQATLAEAPQTLHGPRQGPDFVPWAVEIVSGHRYRLTNTMSTSARNVTVALDRAILRPSPPSWEEIPPASSVSFVCQPAWGSSHELKVSWDSADYADGRGNWTDVI